MRLPVLTDTIVAVSSAWQAAPLGILRLTGPAAFDLVDRVSSGPRPSTTPCFVEREIEAAPGLCVPATVYYFAAPRSYTGQDVVEIHTVGALPLLRRLAGRLIEVGAHRALPGEFTARAFLNGKLAAAAVDAVAGLISASDQASARRAARMLTHSHAAVLDTLTSRLLDLLARLEAGIDFADEEDIRFITAAELRARLAELSDQLAAATGAPGDSTSSRSKPHVALAGLPNAGKSTLFNALIGVERAIVAPVLGTTRDVLSAPIDCGGVEAVLQDCAGLGHTPAELELAAHLAAERAADAADLVLWVHDAAQPWSGEEQRALERLSAARVLVVLSKRDLVAGQASPELPAGCELAGVVSVETGAGLAEFRASLAEVLAGACRDDVGDLLDERLRTAEQAIRRALATAAGEATVVTDPELVAFELREALVSLQTVASGVAVEAVLGRILAEFCVGK